MPGRKISRRKFIKVTTESTAVFALGGNLIKCTKPEEFDPKGLPTRILGKTGVEIPLIALGLGSRFCSVSNEDDALNILTYALDNGLYYWDTAHIYTNGSIISEERLGKIIKHRRGEIFIST